MTKGWKRASPILVTLALFALNAWICRELFTMEFMRNTDSNEGAFVSLSRFFREVGFFERWFPWFNCGMPIENAYQPVLPMAAALIGKLSGWSPERAFHFFLALIYCFGPVTLFWFVLDWSESILGATVAGLLSSLWSPAGLLIPVLHVEFPLRLFNLIHYAEDPHALAVTLLPLALLFLRRRMVVPAVLFCGAVVLSNAFGAMDLAIGGLCIVIAERAGWKRLVATGAVAYCLVSPWLPPSLIALMRKDQWSARGVFHSELLVTGLSIALLAGVVWGTSKLRPFTRFAILFGLIMCAIPMAFFLGHVTFVPQANRYQLELEMGVCILCGRLFSLPRPYVGMALPLIIVLTALRADYMQRKAGELLQPLVIATTTQYRTNAWLNANLRGERAMVAGDTEFLYNVVSNNPQMSGGHEPTAPNWSELVGIYAFYVGAPNPDDAILWLKTFGAHAATAVVSEHKFNGHLSLLWSDGATDIFAVPHRGSSLAHVVPAAALVKRQPIHSLDVDPLRPYVAALEDPALPLAEMHGHVIRTLLHKDEAISVQVNYAPGWQATVGGRKVPVHADAIGLIAIEPECEGDCQITLRYGVSIEAWICRVLSLLAAIALVGWRLFASRRRNASVQPPLTDGPVFAG